MGLKLFIEKIRPTSDVVEYSDATERQTYKEYLPKDNLPALEELKKILDNSIEYTQSPELKLGLGIILVLISHKNEDVRASALGKLFLLVDEESIRELIIKELKNMSKGRNQDLSKSTRYSLDLVATEIHKVEMIEIIFDLLVKLENTIKVKASYFKPPTSSFYLFDRLVRSEFKIKSNIVHRYNVFGSLLNKFRIFSRPMERIFPLAGIKDFDDGNFTEHEIIPYEDVLELESTYEDPLERLASMYANTFMEKGHLRRLEAFLDNDDYNIQQMGVNALIDVVNFLLISSNDKTFIKPSHNSYSEKSSSIMS